MDEIGVYEARTRFAELLDDVERGRRFVITRHGRPIAMLSPVRGADRTRTQTVIETLRAQRKDRRLGMTIREAREEGRR